MDLTNCTPEQWAQNEESFKNTLENTSWQCFPLLNQIDLSAVKDGQLVRFKGMVQDMHTPEYYIESCLSMNKETKESIPKCGKYREFIKLSKNEVIDVYDESTVQKELYTYYVITTPGENQWVKDVEAQQNTFQTEQTLNVNAGNKRSLNEKDSQMDTAGSSSSTEKRQCHSILNKDNHQSISFSTDYLLNFPIEDKKGKSCLVKIYSNENKIKLNDLFEFIGFLSVDPMLSQDYDREENYENKLEVQMHNPPPSLIPRLHCVSFKKLKHSNPLVENSEMDSQFFKKIRSELMIVLTQLLLGDDIAAEYLLCHLISEVYVRKDLMALGKFSINLSNIPTIEDINFVETLYEFIELLLPKSHYFPLTIENANEVTFVPKKDYECNRLNTGLLQLSANTNIVLDETKLKPGKLDPAGVSAVQAIANVIRTQRISYDFNYYPVDFDCDIPFLVASEGKSILPTDCHVVLQPDEEHLVTFNEIVEAVKHFLNPDLLTEIRKYLTLARLVPYNIDDNSHVLIQNKFVEMRQRGATADDLHNVLVLNRLISLSYGKQCLDSETWDIVDKLEEKRKHRLSK